MLTVWNETCDRAKRRGPICPTRLDAAVVLEPAALGRRGVAEVDKLHAVHALRLAVVLGQEQRPDRVVAAGLRQVVVLDMAERHDDEAQIVHNLEGLFVVDRVGLGERAGRAEHDAAELGGVGRIGDVVISDGGTRPVGVVDADGDEPIAARLDVSGVAGHFELANDLRVGRVAQVEDEERVDPQEGDGVAAAAVEPHRLERLAALHFDAGERLDVIGVGDVVSVQVNRAEPEAVGLGHYSERTGVIVHVEPITDRAGDVDLIADDDGAGRVRDIEILHAGDAAGVFVIPAVRRGVDGRIGDVHEQTLAAEGLALHRFGVIRIGDIDRGDEASSA